MTDWNLDRLQEAAAPLPTPSVAAGFRLGKYRLDREIASGGMGTVYEAEDLDLKRPVAVKVMHPRFVEGSGHQERFRREAQAAAKVSHPNLVTVFDATQIDRTMFLVMELVRGRSLAQILDEPRKEFRPLIELLEKAARGVAAAHDAGIIHRDLKPGNILVDPSGQPKVGDFGLAHLVDGDQDLTKTGMTLGTPMYMAPEQVRGAVRSISAATDVYGLGAILYEILAKRPPHTGETTMEIFQKVINQDPVRPRKINPKVTLDLETICMKALEMEPGRRYPNAREFADDLRRFLDGEAVFASPPGTAIRMVRWVKRHRLTGIVVSGAVALGLALAITTAVDSMKRRSEIQKTIAGSLAQGRAAMADVDRDRGELSRLRSRHDALVADIAPFEGPERKSPLWELQAQIEGKERSIRSRRAEAQLKFETVLQTVPDHAGARALLASLHFEDFERAEREDDPVTMAVQRKFVERYDAALLAKIDEPGHLVLESEPAGAAVEMFRFAQGPDRRLIPQADPARRFAPGSWLAILRKAGFRDVRVPIRIRRGVETRMRVRLHTEEEIGADFVYVPSSPFTMGGDRESKDSGDARIVETGDYFIARFEVTCGEYLEWLNHLVGIGRTDEARQRVRSFAAGGFEWKITGGEMRLPPGWEARFPMQFVTWDEAQAFAQWRTDKAGGMWIFRLPTESEWEKAARGVDGRIFPWGNHFDWSFLKGGESREGPPRPEPAGAFPKDESPYGVRDMAGGLQEWCGDWYDPKRTNRNLRGGAFTSMTPMLFRSAGRMGGAMHSATGARGFRLVKVPRE